MNPKRNSIKAPADHLPAPPFDSAFWCVILGHFFSHVHLRDVVEAELLPRKLGLAHHRTMAFIYNNPYITARQLRAQLHVSGQALNVVLSQLIRRELVEQHAGEEDRRNKHLLLTAEGRAVLEASLSRQLEVIQKAARACGPDAVKGFVALVRAMADEESQQWISPLDEASVEKISTPLARDISVGVGDDDDRDTLPEPAVGVEEQSPPARTKRR